MIPPAARRVSWSSTRSACGARARAASIWTWTAASPGASGFDQITDPFGIPSDYPVAGDWNGDGLDDIGVWRPSTGRFYLDIDGSFTWSAGVGPDHRPLRHPERLPGRGRLERGRLRRHRRAGARARAASIWTSTAASPGAWFRTRSPIPSASRATYPVAGDWNGDGFDDIGVWRPSTGRFYLDADGSFTWSLVSDQITDPFGIPSDYPVAGDWNGDGFDDIGVWRPSTGRFYLDADGSFTWTSGVDAITEPFGVATDRPVVGHW